MGFLWALLWASCGLLAGPRGPICGPFRGLWDLVLWDASGDDDLGDLLDLAPADRTGFAL